MLEVNITGQIGQLELAACFRVAPGETLALVGPNGAGKTSVLRILLGALRPKTGVIILNGRTIVNTERRVHLPPEQRRIGYVPQDFALFPHRTALENVTFGLHFRARYHGTRVNKQDILQQAYRWLEALGVAHVAQKLPAALSGGEKQLVALARALACKPEALLLDEPTTALDLAARRHLRQLLVKQLKELNVPVVLVTHDPVDVASLEPRVAIMEEGRVVQIADSKNLISVAETEFVKEFAWQVEALRSFA